MQQTRYIPTMYSSCSSYRGQWTVYHHFYALCLVLVSRLSGFDGFRLCSRHFDVRPALCGRARDLHSRSWG